MITYDIVAPGSAVIWLVTKTATLYSVMTGVKILQIKCLVTLIINGQVFSPELKTAPVLKKTDADIGNFSFKS